MHDEGGNTHRQPEDMRFRVTFRDRGGDKSYSMGLENRGEPLRGDDLPYFSAACQKRDMGGGRPDETINVWLNGVSESAYANAFHGFIMKSSPLNNLWRWQNPPCFGFWPGAAPDIDLYHRCERARRQLLGLVPA